MIDRISERLNESFTNTLDGDESGGVGKTCEAKGETRGSRDESLGCSLRQLLRVRMLGTQLQLQEMHVRLVD